MPDDAKRFTEIEGMAGDCFWGCCSENRTSEPHLPTCKFATPRTEIERLEWQVASGSSMAHVLDGALPDRRRGDRGWRSGPRALCGRYPQRNLEPPWFSLIVGTGADGALRRFMAQQCADCLDALAERLNRPGTPGGESDG